MPKTAPAYAMDDFTFAHLTSWCLNYTTDSADRDEWAARDAMVALLESSDDAEYLIALGWPTLYRMVR